MLVNYIPYVSKPDLLPRSCKWRAASLVLRELITLIGAEGRDVGHGGDERMPCFGLPLPAQAFILKGSKA